MLCKSISNTHFIYVDLFLISYVKMLKFMTFSPVQILFKEKDGINTYQALKVLKAQRSKYLNLINEHSVLPQVKKTKTFIPVIEKGKFLAIS